MLEKCCFQAQGPDGSGYRSPEMCHAWGAGRNVDIWGEQNDFRIHEREILCEWYFEMVLEILKPCTPKF